MTDVAETSDELEDIASQGDVARAPNDAADPRELVEARMPADILERYEVHSYRGAAVLLSQAHPEAFRELCEALRNFRITTTMIRTAGGNESDVPKLLSKVLRPLGWSETRIQGDLLVKLIANTFKGEKRGVAQFKVETREVKRERYLDGHKIDYVKGRVAFDLEWNSKDQTFDRDLYALSAFAQCGVIDVGVLLTRSESLNPVFRQLGQSLKRNGDLEFKKDGKPRLVSDKYGASTTWMGKLLYRLNAGRNGACPVLVIGIKPECIEDWPPADPSTFALPNETGTR
jgi:hypothetical protein